MEQYIIKGGNPLVGEVVIGGAKNAALPVLAAAVMTDGKCMIDNMPDVRDINVLLQAMQEIQCNSRGIKGSPYLHGRCFCRSDDQCYDGSIAC